MINLKNAVDFEESFKETLKDHNLKFTNFKCTVTHKHWHPDLSLYVVCEKPDKSRTIVYLHLDTMMSGCGVMLMRSWALDADVMPLIINNLLLAYKENGCGTFFATLGGPEHQSCSMLVKSGFIPLHSYANYRHGEHWKQTIWAKTI